MAVTGNAAAELALNLPEPAAPIIRDIFDLHMLTAVIATVIMVIVTAMIIYALVKFRKSAGYEADQHFHESWFGRWSWVLVPVIVLGIDLSIAGPASRTLNLIESYPEADVTVKVVGSQWKWSYEYDPQGGDFEGIRLVSNLNKLEPEDEHYLRDVDQPLVLPTNKTIRFLHTATDVLHAWWVPEIAYKKDSIPGYINETWTVIEREGTFRGQCAENCGTGHGYMPIVVKAVSEDEFRTWADGQKVAMASAAAEAASDKVWSMDELMERGKAVYNKNCAACHQENGAGIPSVFPAIAGSPFAAGPVDAHIDIVLNGKAGTAMAPWKDQLNDLEIAAVVTYERNAWGNDAGDMVQSADVKSAR
jgi:cytochrome c oxidase subunit 2